MKRNKVIAIVFGISVIVCMLAAFGVSKGVAADRTPSSNPAFGAPTTELASRYSLEILAPAGIPEKTIYIEQSNGNISGTMDSEHGTQNLTNTSFDGKVLKFTAMLGSDGNESFEFTLKSYGTVLLGECEGGRGPSPVVAKAIE